MDYLDKQLVDAIEKQIKDPNPERTIQKIVEEHGRIMSFAHARVMWSPRDIISEAEDLHDTELTDEQAKSFLTDNAKYIKENMLSSGWETINEFLPAFIAELKQEQAENMADNSEER